jgi:AcrR family transcriptional regulator
MLAQAGKQTRAAHEDRFPAQLADLQRARIVGAMFDVTCERGAASATVAHIVERSGVSRRTFYEMFADREDCFLATFEQALALVRERVLPAYESRERWIDRIRAGLIELLAFVDEQPRVGRLLIVESQAGGRSALERRRRAIECVIAAVDEGRRETEGLDTSPLVAEGVVGGVLAIVQARLVEQAQLEEPARLPLVDLGGPLMSMIVLPYLGKGAARRELNRPTPRSSREDARSGASYLSDPFKAAGIRITYRTVRVLGAIFEHDEASNRAIGQAAGITDQGQISKLLSRLDRLGLIENTCAHPGKGAPNSWALTDRGMQVADSIRTHSRLGHVAGVDRIKDRNR